jgi:tol-pal system protein YbgF
MNNIRGYQLSLLLAGILLPLTGFAFTASAQSKEVREKIDRMAAQVEDLKTELVLLQRTTQTMQDTFNKTMGELNTLIVQISDNISTIKLAQSQVSTNSSNAVTQVSSIGERLTSTNERMERLSEQFAQLKKIIEDAQKGPVMPISPGNPDQLFSAAYADYARGNYPLSLQEFTEYVESYPSSEMADNAQYWIGEIHYAQKNLPEAVAAFEKVRTISPSGDKTAAALYKRGMVLLEMGRREEAVVQLLVVNKEYSKTKEGELALQKLLEIAPDSLVNPKPPANNRPPKRP